MNTNIIKKTQYWLKTVVIGLNFCPFAKAVFDADKILYYVSEAEKLEDCLKDLINQVIYLDEHNDIATSLIIFPQVLTDFDDFLEAIEIGNDLMHAEGYEGVYQLADFHPDYCFAGSDENDPANYTNRSPYPMMHLIREQSIDEALLHYKQPESIPETNITRAESLGLKKMQALLAEALEQ